MWIRNCRSEVLLKRSVVQLKLLVRSVDQKCILKVLLRSVDQNCCSEKSIRKSVAQKCCSEVSLRSVNQKLCPDVSLRSLVRGGKSNLCSASLREVQVSSPS